MKRLLILAGFAMVLALSTATPAHACNVYLPPKSPWTDDEILVYGDGAPVYLTLGELTGPPPITIAKRSLARTVANAFSVTLSFTVEPLTAQITQVPEPGTPTMLGLGVILFAFRKNHCRSGVD